MKRKLFLATIGLAVSGAFLVATTTRADDDNKSSTSTSKSIQSYDQGGAGVGATSISGKSHNLLRASQLNSQSIKSRAGETLGTIEDLIVDRFGRRPVILISLFGSALDYALLAFAPNLRWFFVGRIIAGITGANLTAAMAYIADVSPPEKRAANFGLIGAAFGVGFIIGPALGGLLGKFGLRVPFMVAGGLTLLNWLYGCFVLPESLAPQNRRAFSWGRANPVGSLLDLRRYPVVLGLALTFFLFRLAHEVYPNTWVLYTSYRYEWNVTQVGLSLAAVGLTAALVQGGLTGRVVARLGERKTTVFGLAVMAAVSVAYGLATEGWMIYPIIAAGAFAGVTAPAIQGLISRNVTADAQGGVQGSLSSLTGIAGIIGPPITTGLFGHFVSPSAAIYLPGAAFFFAAVLVFLGLILAVRSFRRTPPEPTALESRLQPVPAAAEPIKQN